jgi:HK97 family phage major capsid protein
VLSRLGLRRAPFHVSAAVQTTGAAAGWVGEAKPKPISASAFTSATVDEYKITAQCVVTEELLRSTDPESDRQLRDDLVRAVSSYATAQAFDPAVTLVANITPASLTQGAPSTAASGATAAALATDIKALIAAFFADNADAERAAIVMRPSDAVTAAIALGLDTLGTEGGSLYGIPVLTSGAVGARITMLDPDQQLLAEGSEIAVDASRQASMELDSVGTDPTVAATVMVRLWQRNLVALRAERAIAWQRARTNSVRLITGVAYA